MPCRRSGTGRRDHIRGTAVQEPFRILCPRQAEAKPRQKSRRWLVRYVTSTLQLLAGTQPEEWMPVQAPVKARSSC